MRPLARSGRLLSVGMAVAVSCGALALPMGVLAQDPAADPASADCTPEVEPNELPEQAPSVVGEVCQTGTLPDQIPADQDLLSWEVLPEDGLTTWSFTVRGVPTTMTSVHVIPVTSPPGVLPLETGSNVLRVDSDAHLDTPPGVAQSRIAPGRYLLGISRGLPGFDQLLTDDLSYEMRLVRTGELPPSGDVEPNDDPASATPLAGPFALSGELQATNDVYRWTLTDEAVAAPLRLEAETALGAPLVLDLLALDGTNVATATAGLDGVATLHDLGLAPGDYTILVSPAASLAQPYTLAAGPVTDEGVDREPNDTPDRALPLDPASLAASGRLTSDPDVDQYAFELDATLAANLIDIDLSWSEGIDRSLCLWTDVGTRIACLQGDGHVALAGLLLAEGRYRLEVSGTGSLDDRYRLGVTPGASLPPSGDVEPNDDALTASPVAGAFAVSGDLAGSIPGAGDVYAWTLSDVDAARSWRLELSGTPGIGGTLELRGPDGASLASAPIAPDGTARIFDLHLPAGPHTAWVTQNGSESPRYVLRGVEETAPDVDAEPNDTLQLALALDPSTMTARGRLASDQDIDVYAFDVDAGMAASLLDVYLAWPSDRLYQLCLTELGSLIQCREARDGIALSDLQLAPGRYELHVSGQGDPDSRYDVSVTSALAPSPDHEIEPNDVATAAAAWNPTLVMHGRSRDGDIDTYRVAVEGVPQVWRLEATGTDLGLPQWTQPDGTHVGSATVADDGTAAVIEDLYLVAGSHLLSIGADGEYTISLTPLGSPDLTVEREPNDDPAHAGPILMDGMRTGRIGTPEDVDIFRFSLRATDHVVLRVEPPADGSIGLEITSAGASLAVLPSPDPGQPTVFDGVLPASDYEVWLRAGAAGSEPYTVHIDRADPFVAPGPAPAELGETRLEAVTSTPEVAAYLPDGQAVEGILIIANDGAIDATLALDWASSHHAWRVDLPQSVDIPTGSTASVPFTIHVPPDAWRGVPIRITFRARGQGGAQVSAPLEITPERDQEPVAPETVWSVPEGLLGGLDVASHALGAVPTSGGFDDWAAHDGVVVEGTGALVSFPNGPFTFSVDLAGDEPVPVAGVIVDPLGPDPQFAFRPRAFELLLSEDGVTFEPVLAGEMSPLLVDQPFVLDAPVEARFAQLRIDSTWGGTEGGISLGEWKVVATPGFAPDVEPIDIAAWSRGGHVALTDPQADQAAYLREMLEEGDFGPRTFALSAQGPVRWMLGFREGRAAQVSGIEWVDPPGADQAALVPSVEVEVSTSRPLGRWRSLGLWQLQRGPDGTVAPFHLAEPAWARYVRLSIPEAADPSVTAWVMPTELRVIERPTDETYRSILGEWGQDDSRGPHELANPPSKPLAAEVADAPDEPDAAQVLAASQPVAGQVLRNRDVDWYAMTVPEGQDTLMISLRTDPVSGARPVVHDEAGRALRVERALTDDPFEAAWSTIVEPGTYRIRIEQPLISSVIDFDTSSSVLPYVARIRNAIGAFAADITPGDEAVQLLPFGEAPLLESFSDQAYLVQGAFDAWVASNESSDVEANVRAAAALLEERDSARAVLLLTDGISTSFPETTEAWRALGRTGTIVFPVHVGAASDPVVSTLLMKDLAVGTGGFYQYATSQADMDRAFDRMATWLRRPASYELSYETAFIDYPPGSLSVVPAAGASVPIGGGVSLELVLDTSGSMNKRIEGVTRMAMAQSVLGRLVDETLPEGLPVALRTFKAGRGSCDTVMAVPFGPLERATMRGVIDDLRINKETRTPLGATLHAVGDDLAERPGPKIVVFVTDGKETCKGDPAAEVERLVELGVEVAMNIVGFALEDPALKADMASWAATGGGVFFDAQDQESLLAGIAAALRAPYRVYDRDSALVASGVVGGPGIELPPDTYRVEVLSAPPATYDEVEVPPGEAVLIEIAPPTP